MKHNLTRIRNAEIVRRIAAGEHARNLAEEYNLGAQYVSLLSRNAGVYVDGKREKQERVLKRQAVVAELHTLGISGGQAIRIMGVSRPTFYKDVRELGLKFPYDTTNCAGVNNSEAELRADKMASMYRSGMTLHQIGQKYGISRERVRQVLTGSLGITHKDGGAAKRGESRRARIEAKKNAEYLASHGCTWAQYKEVRAVGHAMVAEGRGVYQTPFRAFASQKSNATSRGIGWDLTFWQWWTIWQESGKWESRGRARNSFVMSRHRDEGGYSIGNVYIGTLAENSSDQPNNPYRIDHPGHDAAYAAIAHKLGGGSGSSTKGRPSPIKKDKDLPVGVRRTKAGNYMAAGWLNGKSRYFGTHPTADAAHAAYIKATAPENTDQMEAA